MFSILGQGCTAALADVMVLDELLNDRSWKSGGTESPPPPEVPKLAGIGMGYNAQPNSDTTQKDGELNPYV